MAPISILMVTPYAPIRDGIAAYAVQEVKALRAAGHRVEVLSPGPSAAHHHLALRSPRGPLALAKRVRRYDKLIIQYHPDVFYPWPITAAEHRKVTLGLIACLRLAHDSEVRVHEFDHEPRRHGRLNEQLLRRMWASAGRLTFHTAVERDLFRATYGVPDRKLALIAHGGHFEARTRLDRAAARQVLGLDPEAFVFCSIGFIQPHKGFDRAIRAFAGLGRAGAELHVVGSVRVDEPEYVAHLDELVALAEATPGVSVHPGYLGDEAFDQWLVAADAVVLPYRHIWSSGVMERAALYGTPVIATRVGGLADQAPPGTVLVVDDDELRSALRACLPPERAALLARPPAAESIEPWPADLTSVQAEIRRRASRRAPVADRPVPGRPVPGR